MRGQDNNSAIRFWLQHCAGYLDSDGCIRVPNQDKIIYLQFAANGAFRTSPFTTGCLLDMNKRLGHIDGGIFWSKIDNKHHTVNGTLQCGNSVEVKLDCRGGVTSSIVKSKKTVVEGLESFSIIKSQELSNVKNFVQLRHLHNVPGHYGKIKSDKIPALSKSEEIAAENAHKCMLANDKKEKAFRKRVCEEGATTENVRMYRDKMKNSYDGCMNSFVENSAALINKGICAYFSGQWSGDGTIDEYNVVFTQDNEAYNIATKDCLIEMGFGQDEISAESKRVKVHRREAQLKVLFMICIHCIYRREQILIGMIFRIFFRNESFRKKITLQKDYEAYWESLSEEEKNDWINRLNRLPKKNRTYENGVWDDKGMKCFAKVFRRVLKGLLQVQKKFMKS